MVVNRISDTEKVVYNHHMKPFRASNSAVMVDLLSTLFLVSFWFSPKSFSTYFPIISHSIFIRSPGFFESSVVSDPVCGIMETLKFLSVTEATVRLMPSSATEPFSTM